MQVYHLKSLCQVETAHEPKSPQIGLGGTDQNKISSMYVYGIIGQNEISTIILEIRVKLRDDHQPL